MMADKKVWFVTGCSKDMGQRTRWKASGAGVPRGGNEPHAERAPGCGRRSRPGARSAPNILAMPVPTPLVEPVTIAALPFKRSMDDLPSGSCEWLHRLILNPAWETTTACMRQAATSHASVATEHEEGAGSCQAVHPNVSQRTRPPSGHASGYCVHDACAVGAETSVEERGRAFGVRNPGKLACDRVEETRQPAGGVVADERPGPAAELLRRFSIVRIEGLRFAAEQVR